MTRGVFVEIPRLSLWIVTGCQQVTQRDPSSAGLALGGTGWLVPADKPLFVCLSVCEMRPCHRGHRGKCHPGSNQLAQERSGDTTCDIPVGREQRWWPWHGSCAGSGL